MAEGEGGDGVVLASRASKFVVLGKGDRVAVDQEELLIPFEQRPNLADGSAGAKDLRFEGEMRDSVIWDDCTIGRGVVLESCIVAHGVKITSPVRLKNAIICRDDPAIPRDSSYRFEHDLVIAQF